jgi:hypothetical protein
MVSKAKSTLASTLLIAITTLAIVLTNACRTPRPPGDPEADVEAAGEPEQYSATVVRTFDDGTTRETSITREARSGDKHREEWTERDQNRALIWRPDLGKGFLLDLDRRVYVELEIAARHIGESQARAGNPAVASAQESSGLGVRDTTVEAINHYFDETQSPTQVQTRILSPAVIDGHSCRVYEQRTTFHDGHTEISRRFRAEELGGLALRIEGEADRGTARVTTERRDIRMEVAPDSFVVPADFKRIDRLR